MPPFSRPHRRSFFFPSLNDVTRYGTEPVQLASRKRNSYTGYCPHVACCDSPSPTIMIPIFFVLVPFLHCQMIPFSNPRACADLIPYYCLSVPKQTSDITVLLVQRRRLSYVSPGVGLTASEPLCMQAFCLRNGENRSDYAANKGAGEVGERKVPASPPTTTTTPTASLCESRPASGGQTLPSVLKPSSHMD